MLSIAALTLALVVQGPDSGRTASGLWYEAVGSGPTLVLLHGSNLDSRSWGTLPESLAATRRVVRTDLRSHGKSADATGPFSWADDVVEVLDAVGARQATLVGHSLGAQVALDVALAHAGRVDGLVLVAPAISGLPLTKPPAGIESLMRALRAGDMEQAGDALAAMPVMTLLADTSEQAAVRAMVKENVRLFRARPEWVRPLSPPAIDRLESVQVPVLVLLGEHDPTESNEAGRVLLNRVKEAVGETLPGCGHLVPMECAHDILEAMRSTGHRQESRGHLRSFEDGSTRTHLSLRP